MKSRSLFIIGIISLLVGIAARAEIKIVAERNQNEDATARFKFKNVPSPSKSDAATRASFTIVDGQRDGNGGEIEKLHDGRVPTEEDQPSECFFFSAGTDGGRLLVDLGSTTEVMQVNTYSWHSNTRAPQLYKLYASAGKTDDFKAQPKKDTDPEKCGWKLLGKVDTRPKEGEGGGQYGVSVADSEGPLGNYRYLLFDVSQTEDNDAFGNTFYSEIDVIGKDDAAAAIAAAEPPFMIHSTDGYCEISIDTSGATDLKDWAEHKLAPVLAEWYPKLTAMLPSEGYSAPTKFSISIRPGNGVAATGGTRVTANSTWLKRELNREAIGALLHEEVHVVQQYRQNRRANPNATRPPGWLTEAIPDYIRWFKYEPQSHGADLTWMRSMRNFTPRYNGSYRVSANFLDWVSDKYDKDIVPQLNAAIRSGNYSEGIWKEHTGHSMEELGDEWKKIVEEKLSAGIGGDSKPKAAAGDEKPAGGK